MAFHRHSSLGSRRRWVGVLPGKDVSSRKRKIRKLVSPSCPVSNESDLLRGNLVAVQVSSSLQTESRRYCGSAEITSRCVDEPLARDIVQTCVRMDPLTPIAFLLTSIRSSLGLSHDLSKRVGATYDVPHGISSVRNSQPVRTAFDGEDAVHHTSPSGCHPNESCDAGGQRGPCSGPDCLREARDRCR